MKIEKKIVKRANIIVATTLAVMILGAVKLMPLGDVFASAKTFEAPAKIELNEYTKQEYIEVLHDEMNNIVGWGAIKHYENPSSADWVTWEESEVARTNYEELALLFTDEKKQQDIMQLGQIVDYVNQSHDVEALRYVHRILHDLDYFVVNIGWNATTSERYRILLSDTQGNVPTSKYEKWVVTN